MSNYAKNLAASVSNRNHTPQTEAIPGREAEMAQNNAGGFSFIVSPWDMLDRFLILGTEGGSYYATEKKMTKENATNVAALIKTDGLRVVARVVEISDAGRAPKNDPALFVLALCSAADDEKVRKAALDSLSKVARIPTHLFHYASFVEGVRGWGRSLRKAIANWYLDQPVDRLANHVIKYQGRDGWQNRDLLRLSHPKTADVTRNTIFKWVVSGIEGINLADLHPMINAFEQAKIASDENEIIRLITDFQLPRECIPTQFLNSPRVWEALLEKMPITAMIRNLAKMTSINLISAGSAAEKKVCDALGNSDTLRKARVHPIQILSAMMTYQSGHGVRGSLTWSPTRKILDNLDGAFYGTFGNIEPTNRNTLIGLDISGSMGGGEIAGVPGLTPRIASAALSLIIANVEPNYEIVGFTSGNHGGAWTKTKSAKSTRGSFGWYGGDTGILPLKISPRQRLDDVIKTISGLPFGITDCALPMIYAQNNNRSIENFIVISDNETYANGEVHPSQALRDYRIHSNLKSKLAVIGMTSTGFSIADRNDSGQMDFVGFDTGAMQVMMDFFKV